MLGTGFYSNSRASPLVVTRTPADGDAMALLAVADSCASGKRREVVVHDGVPRIIELPFADRYMCDALGAHMRDPAGNVGPTGARFSDGSRGMFPINMTTT